MATSLSASVRISLTATYINTLNLSSVTQPTKYGITVPFENGGGANQANKIFVDQRTLAASATENLDLSGALADAFGNLLAFTKIKALLVAAAVGNLNDVLVGGAAANGFIAPFGDATDVIKVKPGGSLLLSAPDAAGYPVVAGTADLLKVANSGGGTGVTYDIVLIGA